MHVNDASTSLTPLRPGLAALTPESREAGRSAPGEREQVRGAPASIPTGLRPADGAVSESIRTDIARAAGEPEETLRVKDLLAAWGKDDPDFDLNADGTVDMADLVMLLSELAAKAGGDGSTDEPASLDKPGGHADDEPHALGKPEGPPAELTVSALLDSWGKADTQYDLNADGTVDMADLVALLGRMVDSGPPPADLAGTGDEEPGDTVLTNLRETASDLASRNPLTVRDLLDAWGREDTRYDLDQSGRVDMQDLVMLLSRLNEERRGAPDGEAVAAGPAAPGGNTDPARIERVATALTARLRDHGFTEHPPTNIHALVAQTSLDPSAQKALLDRLQEHYPAGLGVNTLG